MPTYVPDSGEDTAPPLVTNAVVPVLAGGEAVPTENEAGKDVVPDPSTPHVHQQLFLLIILLAVYCGPIIAVTLWAILDWAWLTQNQSIGKGLINLLSTFGKNPDRYTSVINQMILPAAAAITVIGFHRIDTGRWGAVLFILPLVGLLACILNALIFDVATLPVGTSPAVRNAISSMFLSAASNLSIYVMMLVGLKAVEK